MVYSADHPFGGLTVLPSDTAFRFSTYLSLVLSCACLGYAEWDYLPEISVFAALVAAAMVVSFFLEGKFALTLLQANCVGGAILVLAVVWFAFHWKRDHELLNTLPSGALPFVGPLLLAVTAAKLFRPKHAGDWWAMYGVGLCGVILAGALAEDEIFVLLFLLYLPSAAWSLTLFFQRRAAAAIPPVPPPPPRDSSGAAWDVATWFPWLAGSSDRAPTVAGPPPDSYPVPRGSWLRRSHFLKTVGLVAAAAVLALPAFFLTPRSQGMRWQLPRNQLETGFSPDAAIDLAKTGTLHVSQDPAFEVTALNADGSPKDDLPVGQRWRGTGYVEYDNGKWNRNINFRLFASPPTGGLVEQTKTRGRLPDLGPDRFTLEFNLSQKVRGVVLADPVVYAAGQPGPVIHEFGGGTVNWVQHWDGTFIPTSIGAQRIGRYKQAFNTLADPDAGVPFVKNTSTGDDVFQRLKKAETGEITRWSRRLLDTLDREGHLPPIVQARRHPVTRLPAERDYRAVGEAFRDYLAAWGGYKYSLELTRQDRSIDPIEDFLFNTKSGHCERYATALVLMLRSVGIPAQFVLGFKGCEGLGDGKYVVKQEDAHAWAEILVPVGPPENQMWQWVTLDPTPVDSAAATSPGLWESARLSGRRLFHQYIVGLSPDSQKQIVSDLLTATDLYYLPVLSGAAALGMGLLALMYRRKTLAAKAVPAAGSPSAVPWYERFVRSLCAAGLPVEASATPSAVATAAGAWLTTHGRAEVADVPSVIAAAVYAARYAGVPLTAEQSSALNVALDRLDAALAGGAAP